MMTATAKPHTAMQQWQRKACKTGAQDSEYGLTGAECKLTGSEIKLTVRECNLTIAETKRTVAECNLTNA